MFKFIRKMIYLGKQLLTSLFVGKGRENPDVYAGNVKVYPDTAPEPVITYTVTNIYTHISGDLKVNGSNAAYITATVTEYHDGKQYASHTETAKTFTDLYRVVDDGNGYLRYDVDTYGWTESAYQQLTVKFSMYGGEYSVRIPVEANEMHIEDTTVWYADCYPPVNINPEGEEIIVYPEYRNTRKRVYTSGKESILYSQRLAGSCNIYFDYGQGKELWGDDVAVTTGGQGQRFNFPKNSGYTERDVIITVEAFTIEGDDVLGQYPDIVLTLHQMPVSYTITWDIYGTASTTQVSMSPTSYVPVPSVVMGNNLSSFRFYVTDVEDYDPPIIEEGGKAKTYTYDWVEEVDNAVWVQIDNIKGDISISMHIIPTDSSNPPTPPPPVLSTKYRVIVDDCITCGACYGICPEGAISIDEDGIPHIEAEFCTGCGVCFEACPNGAIEEYLG